MNCAISGNVPTDPFSVPSVPGGAPTPLPPQVVNDGQVVWRLDDSDASQAQPWTANKLYTASTEVQATVTASNGHVYRATRTGVSGGVPTQPYFPITPLARSTPEVDSAARYALAVEWEDIGTTPPASVASGQPADLVMSLLNLQFAQSHSLSYYNLASGVMYSLARSQTFAFNAGCSTTTASSCAPSVIGGSNTVDPVLLFTIYPKPWDSETRCKNGVCFGLFKTNPPGFSFGLSLSSPSSRFYAGMSFEVLRNIQLVMAANFAKESRLPSATVTEPSSAIMSGTPVSVQRFTVAPAFGLTLNISGFIQSLFGGGGGGGGGKGTGSTSPSPSGSQ